MNLTISHYIFLNREQRYKLYDGDLIEVVGHNVPFFKKNKIESAKEVFCQYYITSHNLPTMILRSIDGYIINISKNLTKITDVDIKKILDVKDGGCEEISCKHIGKTLINKKVVRTNHFFEIKTMELLLDTISC